MMNLKTKIAAFITKTAIQPFFSISEFYLMILSICSI